MANIITSCRILCGLLLLFVPVFSPCFYAFYIAGGLTDMIDGTIARMMHRTSEFGSKLDTAADFIFIASVLFKVLSSIHVPLWLWAWIACIACIKIINVISGFVLHKRFVAEHTIMNKIAGIMLFIIPLCIGPWRSISAIAACAVSTLAAIQEGHCIRTGKEVS